MIPELYGFSIDIPPSIGIALLNPGRQSQSLWGSKSRLALIALIKYSHGRLGLQRHPSNQHLNYTELPHCLPGSIIIPSFATAAPLKGATAILSDS